VAGFTWVALQRTVRLTTRRVAPPTWSERPTQSNSQRVARGAEVASDRDQAGKRDQADRRAALIAEHVARHIVEGRCAARLVGEEADEEGGYGGPAGRGQRGVGDARAVGGADSQHAVVRVESGAQAGDACVFQQAHEVGFGQEDGGGRVEAGIALGEGEGAVPGQGGAGLEFDRLERLCGQPLHRIAVESFDLHTASDRDDCLESRGDDYHFPP